MRSRRPQRPLVSCAPCDERSPFPPDASTHDRGVQAEDLAAAWLTESGYRILTRNYRTAVGEIDVVAAHGEVLCFVEVKARSDLSFGSPLAAVTAHRRRRLGRGARLYLAESGWDGPCRFDVLGMVAGEDGWEMELVRDAFWV